MDKGRICLIRQQHDLVQPRNVPAHRRFNKIRHIQRLRVEHLGDGKSPWLLQPDYMVWIRRDTWSTFTLGTCRYDSADTFAGKMGKNTRLLITYICNFRRTSQLVREKHKNQGRGYIPSPAQILYCTDHDIHGRLSMCINGPFLSPAEQRHFYFPLHGMLRHFCASGWNESGSGRPWSSGLDPYGDPFSLVLGDRNDRCTFGLQGDLLPVSTLPFSCSDGRTPTNFHVRRCKKCDS